MQLYPKFQASVHRLPRRLQRYNLSENPTRSDYFKTDKATANNRLLNDNNAIIP